MLTRRLLSILHPKLALDPRASERGFATVAVALAAFLATATTAATLTIADGSLNFEGLEDMVESSVRRAGATLEVRGSIVARAEDGASVTRLQVPLRLYGAGGPVSFHTAVPERLLIAYHDADSYVPDIAYSVEILTGNGDSVLDAWETAVLTVDLPHGMLLAGERFTLELAAPVGGTVILQRTLPPILQPVMSLY